MADDAAVFDNSDRPRLVLSKRDGTLELSAETPDWLIPTARVPEPRLTLSVKSADALTALMEAPTDAEIIERLRLADQEAMEMGRRVGPGNWANISAMALAFYALKTEDPETVVSENLERVGLIVRHYGPTRPGWGDSLASDDASAMQTDSDVRVHLLMQAQDYLESLVDGYFQSFGPGRETEAVAGIGNHINVGTAAACMRFTDPQDALRRCGETAEWAVAFVREQCEFVDRGECMQP